VPDELAFGCQHKLGLVHRDIQTRNQVLGRTLQSGSQLFVGHPHRQVSKVVTEAFSVELSCAVNLGKPFDWDRVECTPKEAVFLGPLGVGCLRSFVDLVKGCLKDEANI
jgi:hypothetical protein